MIEQFVTFEIALALKELGFDEECICVFDSYKNLRGTIIGSIDGDYLKKDKWDSRLPAPLWQQVIDWLREIHKINILIAPIYSSGDLKGYVFNFGLIIMNNLSEVFKNGKFETFYEAREQAILKAIELCQKNF